MCFVPSLVEIGPLVLKKKILKFCQCISAISLLCPLGKMPGLSFEQTWISSSQEFFVLSLVEIGSSSGEKGENVKSLQTDRQTKDARRARWAKNVFLRMISVENTKHHQCQLCRFTALSKKCQITRRPKENFFLIKHPLKFLLLVTLW